MAARSTSTWSLQSAGSLDTPILLRSESFESTGAETRSPITPDHAYGMTAHLFPPSMHAYKDPLPYDAHFDGFSFEARPTLADHRHDSFDSRLGDDEVNMDESGLERAAKRYPCRYRDSHGCEKTFTTSGHASRHSKIHTAEKAVQCTFEHCSKKFTRSDNMKQHLETHNKDRERAARPLGHRSSGSRSGLVTPAGVKKPASGNGGGGGGGGKKTPLTSSPNPYASSSLAYSPTSGASKVEFATLTTLPDTTIYGSYHALGGHASSSFNPFEMDGFCNVLMSRPTPARTTSAGLDALAQAAASVPEKMSGY